MAFAADPTTVEPTLEDSFNTVIYDGTGTTNPRTDVGFEPDFVWIKSTINPSNGVFHTLMDSVRGKSNGFYKSLFSNTADYEDNIGGGNYFQSVYGGVSSFDSNGFTLNNGSASNDLNVPSTPYVAWCWKGAELPAINSNGSIPSVVSANPAAGFSIVAYDGNDVDGATIGHGLASAPQIIFIKRLNEAAEWIVSSSLFGNPARDNLRLDTTAAINVRSEDSFIFGTDTFVNKMRNNLGDTYIAYCFAKVAGFSKFGSYPGGTLNRQVDCQFEPAFVMIKNTTNAASWAMFDNKRGVTGGADAYLAANLSDAEADVGARIEFNDTGFELTTTNSNYNAASNTYIFMAFANQF